MHSTSTEIDPAVSLSEIQELVQNNCFEEAFERTQSLQGVFPRNIFLAGLNKQVERFLTIENGTPEEVASLRISLQPLIERALESIRNTPAPHSARTQSSQPETLRSKSIDKLKARYFAEVETLMKKGDYDNALAEVHRILLLDSADNSAHELIRKLGELSAAQRQSRMTENIEKNRQTAAQTVGTRASGNTPSASLNELVTMTKPDFESIISKKSLGGESSPVQQGEQQNTAEEEPAPSIQPKKKSSSFLFGSAFFIILAIVAAYFITTSIQSEATEAEQPHAVQSSQAKQSPPSDRRASGAETQPPGSTRDSVHSTIQ